MDSQISMSAFIPEVVKEEQRRQELKDEHDLESQSDDDEIERWEDMEMLEEPVPSETLLSNMFGIR
jgi:hypothetical protein